MNSTNNRKTLNSCLLVLAFLGLVLNMAAFAESNPLGGNCGDDCTNECDSSCTDCNYCLNCFATNPIAVTLAFDHCPFNTEPSHASLTVILPVKQNLSFDIDHPPQILS